MYSRIVARTRRGSRRVANMRLMTDAERPEALWSAFKDGPGRASTEPKRLGLLVQCKPIGDKSVAELPDLVRLSRF